MIILSMAVIRLKINSLIFIFLCFFLSSSFPEQKALYTETTCMKCQLFSWKNKKNINSLTSTELAQRIVKVKNIL